MLMCGDLRLGATLLIAAALCACNLDSGPPPSASPASAAHTPAGDLRTRLDLLLSEQVMIIAKQAGAAVNHSDEYTAYASLLTANSADLTTLFALAFGNTASVQFGQVWNSQNGFLVDYAIGLATHNDDKSKIAISSLTDTFTPHFALLAESLTRVPASVFVGLLGQQFVLEKSSLDALAAGDFTTYYLKLHYAYSWIDRVGDVLAEQIASQFADKYPGDPLAATVNSRVLLNLALQQRAYLETMATDATLNGRAADKAGALVALGTNGNWLESAMDDQRFALIWSRESGALLDYAVKGDGASRSVLTDTFVAELANITKHASGPIASHENATIKVVDDQRARAKSVADDDRAAATSMQPIADSVQ